jgi:protein-disulfide isomerase
MRQKWTSTLMTVAMPKTQSYPALQVIDGDHIRGASEAPVTILVYGDYQCPYTRAFESSLAHLRRTDGDTFRSVYRHFPLREIHPHAQNAAEAAEAVYALGGAEAFWLMHDGLFAHQDRLDTQGLERQAVTAGVDSMALRAALGDHRCAWRVERDVRSGLANVVGGTPSIFIDGEFYFGARDVPSLRALLATKAGGAAGARIPAPVHLEGTIRNH